MTDCFALLDVERHPWLDPDLLREKFHALAARHHPDVAADPATDFAPINAAYRTLSDPVLRLRHLLELEASGASFPSASPSPAIATLFTTLGALQQRLAAFQGQQTQARTPIARAVLASEKLSLRSDCEAALASLEQQETPLLQELRSLDDDWRAHRPRLSTLQRDLAFLQKWHRHFYEATTRLAA